MTRKRVGEITLPSGALTIFDPGYIAMRETGELETIPTVVIGALPKDRTLPVWGARVGSGRWKDCWDHIAIEVSKKKVVSSKKVGDAAVDFARLLLADESNPGKWMHNDSIDGKADFVFWGLNAPELAAAIHAPAIGDDEFGWTDIPVNESEQRYEAAEALKAERGWRLATDLRPHSHHWQALALARAAPTESSTIDVDDLRVCLFFTSWGDGSFPVYIDLDAAGKPAQIRIQLQTEDSIAAMESVNK